MSLTFQSPLRTGAPRVEDRRPTGFVVMWWLNERFGVRKLKDLRAKAAAMFEAAD